MKRLAWAGGLAGLALFLGLLVREGWVQVATALSGAGFALLWLVPFHAIPIVLDAQGWRVLLAPVDPQGRASLLFLSWVATVREAVNRLLPTANLGGDLVGIRLARLRIPDTGAVAASVILEMLLTLVNQYIFTSIGLMLLLMALPAGPHATTLGIVLLVALLPLGLLSWVLRHGALFTRIETLAKRILGDHHRLFTYVDGADLDHKIRLLYAQPYRLFISLMWQLAGYMIGSLETWFALFLLGHRVSAGAAIGIEALSQATRIFLFMFPAGLGVQEASVVLFAGLAGVGGHIGLSLALAKRMREILFGVPALLSWQWLEARFLKRSIDPNGASVAVIIPEQH